MYNIETRKISIPFTNFLSGTIISPSQMNTNFDEVEYCFNQLLDQYNARLLDTYSKQEVYDLETKYDKLLKANATEDYAHFTKSITDNVKTLNDRITNEVSTLNSRITNEKNSLNQRITNEVSTLNNTINSKDASVRSLISSNDSRYNARFLTIEGNKGDRLKLTKTVIQLMSGDKTLSVVDLAPILGSGGGGSYASKGVAYSFDTMLTDWTEEVDEQGQIIRYHADINHRLNTQFVIASILNANTMDAQVYPHTVIDDNNIRVYAKAPMFCKIAIINVGSDIELINAILDDTDTNAFRTWTSQKIKSEIDKKSSIVVTNDPNVPRQPNGLYFIITDTLNGGSGSSPGNIVTTNDGYGLKVL